MDVPIRVAALLTRIHPLIRSRAVSFLKMTNAHHTAVHSFILAALLFMGNGVSSEVEESLHSEVFLNQLQDSKSKKPSLQPKEREPPIETYTLKRNGRVCVMARLGVGFVVKENKKTLYYNLDPKATSVSGSCSDRAADLSLVFDGGNLNFTFIKNGDQSYVSTLKALLEPEPFCKDCEGKSYAGILDHGQLFKSTKGKSFMCQSKTQLHLAENLMIEIIPLQIQAFDLINGTFGKETECWNDYVKRIVPIMVGAVVAGIILCAVLVYVLMRERRHNYEQL